MSPVIYLVRHGETVWNAEGRQQGRLDSPLTPKGVEQARTVGKALHHVLSSADGITIETSPLGRATHTAALLCNELGLSNEAAVVSPLLAELDLGAWQGLTFEEIDTFYPGQRHHREGDKWNYRIKNGESYALVSNRARCWLRDLSAKITIAVTHEMISRTIQGAYLSLSPHETLARSHRQGLIYRLSDYDISELAAAS